MSWRCLAALSLLVACSSDAAHEKREPPKRIDLEEAEPRARPRFNHPSPVPTQTYAALDPKAPGSAAPIGFDDRRLVYLVTLDEQLYSFDPRVVGMAAYRLVGHIDCKAQGTPMSMAVDKHGWAWVFYDSSQLFKVSISDASCKPTTYEHPVSSRDLGMGFTSTSAGSKDEVLYILGRELGLATIALPSLEVARSGELRGGELTGGGDGRLFHFSPEGGLSEIDRSTRSLQALHTFQGMSSVTAYAFARYAGRFYVFTAKDGPSLTTEYDPVTDSETVRDPDLGFRVVGAGQSTLVPRPDVGGGATGDFPPAVP